MSRVETFFHFHPLHYPIDRVITSIRIDGTKYFHFTQRSILIHRGKLINN